MNESKELKPLGFLPASMYSIGAVVCFTLAYASDRCAVFILGFLACIYPLVRLRSGRQAYYFGLVIGLLIYTPHLWFFHETFGNGAIALWYILPFWLGLFLILGHACLNRFGSLAWACLAPFVWMGLEFFRGELYYLRFTWLTPGLVFSNSDALHYLSAFGVYGIGFVFMAIAAALHLRGRPRLIGLAISAGLALFPAFLRNSPITPGKHLRITGVQLEFPAAPTVKSALDVALKKFPDTDVFVFSEYTFQGPIPETIKAWCRKNRSYFIAGGEDSVGQTDYFNTAFVVDTNGEIAFLQAKSVPVQFLRDGLPARQQSLWFSPWGKVGLAICYDLSYTRVTDELVRQGAQALIIPTMDVADWGQAQHLLHARIAPMRAAEYRLPVFRVCSSGISQYVDSTGTVKNSAPFQGDGAMMTAELNLSAPGRMPPDRWLARFSVLVTAGLGGWFVFGAISKKIKNRVNRVKSSNP